MGIISRLRLAEKPTPRPDTRERGDTGMGWRHSTSESVRRLQRLEYNWNLTGVTGYKTYDRMRLSDPKVAGLRRAMNLPLLGAAVRIEPADPDDAQAVEIAEFVQRALLSDGSFGMQEPWRAFLSQALLYLDYGFAPFEIVWAMQGSDAVIERFAYRPPSTVCDGIDVERGRIAAVEQVTGFGTNAVIPGEKIVWFCHEREGDNYLGRPLLRPMYKPWFNKEKAEILLLINLEKGGGIPYAREVEAGLQPDERAALDSALESLHVSERGYLRVPMGVDVSMLTGNASLADGLEMLRYWDTQLSNVAIAQVLDLGKTESGSRALGRTMSDMFVDSLTAVATAIEDEMNAAEGPIAQLVAYNFANADDFMPHLRFGSLSKIDIKALAGGLLACSQMGMPFGDETWEWIREELDLPAREPDDQVAPNEAPPAAQPETPPAAEAASGEDEPPAGGVAASECCGCDKSDRSDKRILAEGSAYWRPLTALESFVALDEISEALDGAKDALRERTQAVRDRMVADMAKRAAAADTPAKVAALSAGKAPQVDALTREVRALFEEYFEAGRAQVHDELSRQREGQPVVEQISGERAGESVEMAVASPPRLTTKQARRFYEMLDAQAEIVARGIGAATVSAAAKAVTGSIAAPPSAEVIIESIRRASDSEALKAGFTVTKVIIHGRSAQAQAEREQIAQAVYSAILDARTCAVCEARDGATTEDLDEAETWTPNPECEGTDELCRCMVIYEGR